MNILYIANSRLPTEKAHGLQIMKTAESFLEEGVKVDLLVPRRRNPIHDPLEDFYGLKKIPHIFFIPNYFGFLESNFHRAYFFLQRISFSVSAFFFALFHDADAIYSREISIIFFLTLFGKKAILEDHEPKKSFRWLYFFFVKVIKKKIAVPFYLTELYKERGIKENTYIWAPNGIDLDELQRIPENSGIWKDELHISPKEKIILYVGHFYPWKGVYTFLDASKEIKGTSVLIGGNKPDTEAVQSYIAKHNLTNVTLYPFVKHEMALVFIKSADVLVLPNTAKEERSLRYTTPIKLFEYMASNVPIVASDIPSLSSILVDSESALLFSPDDSHNLAEKVNELLQDRKLGGILASNAKREVLRYTWALRAKKIISFIHS